MYTSIYCKTDKIQQFIYFLCFFMVLSIWYASLISTTCSKSAVRNLQQACRSQLAASLISTTCSKSAVRNLQQVCSSQLAASLQIATCSKPVDNLQQTCCHQAGASDANASWYRLDDRNLQQVCSRLAATCAFLAVYLRDSAVFLDFTTLSCSKSGCGQP